MLFLKILSTLVYERMSVDADGAVCTRFIIGWRRRHKGDGVDLRRWLLLGVLMEPHFSCEQSISRAVAVAVANVVVCGELTDLDLCRG